VIPFFLILPYPVHACSAQACTWTCPCSVCPGQQLLPGSLQLEGSEPPGRGSGTKVLPLVGRPGRPGPRSPLRPREHWHFLVPPLSVGQLYSPTSQHGLEALPSWDKPSWPLESAWLARALWVQRKLTRTFLPCPVPLPVYPPRLCLPWAPGPTSHPCSPCPHSLQRSRKHSPQVTFPCPRDTCPGLPVSGWHPSLMGLMGLDTMF
jgi:hypothetical protein